MGALVEPLDFNFLIASTVWLQAPGTRRWPVSPRRHEAPRSTHTSGEHRALSRGLGVESKYQTAPSLSAFWKPTAMPRHGDRGPEHLSVQTQTAGGGVEGLVTGKTGTAKPPYPPHPQPILLRSRTQWQGVGVGGGGMFRSLATAGVWFLNQFLL